MGNIYLFIYHVIWPTTLKSYQTGVFSIYGDGASMVSNKYSNIVIFK